MEIGKNVQQPGGYKAFIPNAFPPKNVFKAEGETLSLLTDATLAVGRLDGITKLLPDRMFFIFMYVRKEAALSSQIEGTQATMADAVKAQANLLQGLPKDVDDIDHYIKALEYGIHRIKELPLATRFLQEVHKILLTNGRSDYDTTPGEMRRSQNWIGGVTPKTARFVPPPVEEMHKALGDLEKFMNGKTAQSTPPLVKAALIHAQFETIHPFLDGNGRTGRLITSFFLHQQGLLHEPVLYMSEYLKRNRDTYFDLLHRYHNFGEVDEWIRFFLQGIKEVAGEAAEVSYAITILRDKDRARIATLNRSAENGLKVLEYLYRTPIVSVAIVENVTGLSRQNANKLVDKLVQVGILEQLDKDKNYGRTFIHREYWNLFEPKN
jgi:Fic family protein